MGLACCLDLIERDPLYQPFRDENDSLFCTNVSKEEGEREAECGRA